jgi:hypothetical protein
MMGNKNIKQQRYAVEFTGTYYVVAESEDEAKQKWENADFGAGENLDITEIRIVL